MIIGLFIENQQVELFESEDISVTSSVLNVQDLTKNTTDYSKSFTVPASPVNNKIFKHYYNADIDNTFDARVAVSARIEIGGFIFRKGKIVLQEVIVKSGVASSYMINFVGNLVSIKDLLGTDELSDLDLTAFDHEYLSENVLSFLKNTEANPPIIYNLLVKKQYYYNTQANDFTMTDSLANIHYKSGSPNGVMWNDLSASISLYSILEAIETDYGLTFSRDFFGLPKFKNLYLWLNNTKDKKVGGGAQVINWDSGSDANINLATNVGQFTVSNTAASNDNFYWLLYMTITPEAGYENVEYTMRLILDGEVRSEVTTTGTSTLSDRLSRNILPGVGPYTFNAYWEVSSNQKFEYSAKVRQRSKVSGYFLSEVETFASTNTIASVFSISDNMPELKIIDFLKGIFSAFKLVIIPTDESTFYVDTVENYYASGEVIDLTPYVDNESVKVSRGTIFNTLNYKFQEPKTILNKQFLENTGKSYGNEESIIRDANGTLLDGDTLTVDLPFEQVVYERLYDLAGADEINLMYGAIIDENLNPVNIKPHIFYRQLKLVGGGGIGFIQENGTKDQIRTYINTASHVIDDEDSGESFIFSVEFNNFSGEKLVKNLFSNYHQSYIDSIFNIKRRDFTYKCKRLPTRILLKLTLDDKIKIGFNYYRIDKFTTGLISGNTEFKLINL